MLTLNERGEIKFGLIFAIALLGGAIFVGSQLLPIYYDHWQFEDSLNNEKLNLKFVNYPEKTKEMVLKEVKQSLTGMGAKFKEQDVKVTVIDGKKKIIVEVRYNRPHKVPFIKNPMLFSGKYENKTLD